MEVYVVAAYINWPGAPHPLAVCTTADMAICTLQEMYRLYVELDSKHLILGRAPDLPAERLAALRASLDRDGAAQIDDPHDYVRVRRTTMLAEVGAACRKPLDHPQL